jgi:hypothetical protein
LDPSETENLILTEEQSTDKIPVYEDTNETSYKDSEGITEIANKSQEQNKQNDLITDNTEVAESSLFKVSSEDETLVNFSDAKDFTQSKETKQTKIQNESTEDTEDKNKYIAFSTENDIKFPKTETSKFISVASEKNQEEITKAGNEAFQEIPDKKIETEETGKMKTVQFDEVTQEILIEFNAGFNEKEQELQTNNVIKNDQISVNEDAYEIQHEEFRETDDISNEGNELNTGNDSNINKIPSLESYHKVKTEESTIDLYNAREDVIIKQMDQTGVLDSNDENESKDEGHDSRTETNIKMPRIGNDRLVEPATEEVKEILTKYESYVSNEMIDEETKTGDTDKTETTKDDVVIQDSKNDTKIVVTVRSNEQTRLGELETDISVTAVEIENLISNASEEKQAGKHIINQEELIKTHDYEELQVQYAQKSFIDEDINAKNKRSEEMSDLSEDMYEENRDMEQTDKAIDIIKEVEEHSNRYEKVTLENIKNDDESKEEEHELPDASRMDTLISTEDTTIDHKSVLVDTDKTPNTISIEIDDMLNQRQQQNEEHDLKIENIWSVESSPEVASGERSSEEETKLLGNDQTKISSVSNKDTESKDKENASETETDITYLPLETEQLISTSTGEIKDDLLKQNNDMIQVIENEKTRTNETDQTKSAKVDEVKHDSLHKLETENIVGYNKKETERVDELETNMGSSHGKIENIITIASEENDVDVSKEDQGIEAENIIHQEDITKFDRSEDSQGHYAQEHFADKDGDILHEESQELANLSRSLSKEEHDMKLTGNRRDNVEDENRNKYEEHFERNKETAVVKSEKPQLELFQDALEKENLISTEEKAIDQIPASDDADKTSQKQSSAIEDISMQRQKQNKLNDLNNDNTALVISSMKEISEVETIEDSDAKAYTTNTENTQTELQSMSRDKNQSRDLEPYIVTETNLKMSTIESDQLILTASQEIKENITEQENDVSQEIRDNEKRTEVVDELSTTKVDKINHSLQKEKPIERSDEINEKDHQHSEELKTDMGITEVEIKNADICNEELDNEEENKINQENLKKETLSEESVKYAQKSFTGDDETNEESQNSGNLLKCSKQEDHDIDIQLTEKAIDIAEKGHSNEYKEDTVARIGELKNEDTAEAEFKELLNKLSDASGKEKFSTEENATDREIISYNADQTLQLNVTEDMVNQIPEGNEQNDTNTNTKTLDELSGKLFLEEKTIKLSEVNEDTQSKENDQTIMSVVSTKENKSNDKDNATSTDVIVPTLETKVDENEKIIQNYDTRGTPESNEDTRFELPNDKEDTTTKEKGSNEMLDALNEEYDPKDNMNTFPIETDYVEIKEGSTQQNDNIPKAIRNEELYGNDEEEIDSQEETEKSNEEQINNIQGNKHMALTIDDKLSVEREYKVLEDLESKLKMSECEEKQSTLTVSLEINEDVTKDDEDMSKDKHDSESSMTIKNESFTEKQIEDATSQPGGMEFASNEITTAIANQEKQNDINDLKTEENTMSHEFPLKEVNNAIELPKAEPETNSELIKEINKTEVLDTPDKLLSLVSQEINETSTDIDETQEKIMLMKNHEDVTFRESEPDQSTSTEEIKENATKRDEHFFVQRDKDEEKEIKVEKDAQLDDIKGDYKAEILIDEIVNIESKEKDEEGSSRPDTEIKFPLGENENKETTLYKDTKTEIIKQLDEITRGTIHYQGTEEDKKTSEIDKPITVEEFSDKKITISDSEAKKLEEVQDGATFSKVKDDETLETVVIEDDLISLKQEAQMDKNIISDHSETNREPETVEFVEKTPTDKDEDETEQKHSVPDNELVGNLKTDLVKGKEEHRLFGPACEPTEPLPVFNMIDICNADANCDAQTTKTADDEMSTFSISSKSELYKGNSTLTNDNISYSDTFLSMHTFDNSDKIFEEKNDEKTKDSSSVKTISKEEIESDKTEEEISEISDETQTTQTNIIKNFDDEIIIKNETSPESDLKERIVVKESEVTHDRLSEEYVSAVDNSGEAFIERDGGKLSRLVDKVNDTSQNEYYKESGHTNIFDNSENKKTHETSIILEQSNLKTEGSGIKSTERGQENDLCASNEIIVIKSQIKDETSNESLLKQNIVVNEKKGHDESQEESFYIEKPIYASIVTITEEKDEQLTTEADEVGRDKASLNIADNSVEAMKEMNDDTSASSDNKVVEDEKELDLLIIPESKEAEETTIISEESDLKTQENKILPNEETKSDESVKTTKHVFQREIITDEP